jgi:SP family sugar:H+ symporter-like MFS transporter
MIGGSASARIWGDLEAWRWMFLVEAVPSVVFGIAVAFIPESPRYLVAAKKDAAALAVLQRLEGSASTIDLTRIRKTIAADHQPRFSDLRDGTGKILRVVWVGGALAVLQQLVGINTIFYYGDVLWESVGFSASDSLRNNVITGLINVGATIVAMVTIDRVGRRPLLLAGSIGMTVTLAVLMVAFSGAQTTDGVIVLPRGSAIAALVAANVYVFAFAMSWGPVVWVLLGEMFPNSMRGAAMAVSVFAQWMANWLVTITFPVMVSKLGPAIPYFVYLVFAAASFDVVRRAVPETKGRSLEDASAT